MKRILAIGVSLLAACSVFASNANSATLVSKPTAPSNTKHLHILLTAYVPDEGTRTATGRNANLPGIAADFDLLPAGTSVYIPGRGTFVVDDTGGSMRHDARENGICHIDLRILPLYRKYDHIRALKIANHRAMEIGKRWVDVYISYPHTDHEVN